MLCLKRKENERLKFMLEDGTPCEIVVLETSRNWVRLGMDFPKSISISREEAQGAALPELTLGQVIRNRDERRRPDSPIVRR